MKSEAGVVDDVFRLEVMRLQRQRQSRHRIAFGEIDRQHQGNGTATRFEFGSERLEPGFAARHQHDSVADLRKHACQFGSDP